MASALPKVNNARVAAALVYKREIVTIGFNQLKTHPLQKKHADKVWRMGAHAEIHAISRAFGQCYLSADEFRKSAVYVARARMDGTQGLARPCPGCMSCMMSYGIPECWYTSELGNFERERI